MQFREYIENLQAGNKKSESSYLAVQNFKKALPQLSNDLPPYEGIVGKVHAGPYLWIARPGHYEYCHFDPDDGNPTLPIIGLRFVYNYT